MPGRPVPSAFSFLRLTHDDDPGRVPYRREPLIQLDIIPLLLPRVVYTRPTPRLFLFFRMLEALAKVTYPSLPAPFPDARLLFASRRFFSLHHRLRLHLHLHSHATRTDREERIRFAQSLS
jgi:hypothetical protein